MRSSLREPSEVPKKSLSYHIEIVVESNWNPETKTHEHNGYIGLIRKGHFREENDLC